MKVRTVSEKTSTQQEDTTEKVRAGALTPTTWGQKEVGLFLRGQPDLHSKTLFQTNKPNFTPPCKKKNLKRSKETRSFVPYRLS